MTPAELWKMLLNRVKEVVMKHETTEPTTPTPDPDPTPQPTPEPGEPDGGDGDD